MGGLIAPARGCGQYRRAGLLGLVVVVGMLWLSAPTAGAAPPGSGVPIAAARVASSSGLNMRAAPQTSAAVLRVLPYLAEVYILGQAEAHEGHRWVPIRLKPEDGGQEGWVVRRWLVAFSLEAARTQSGSSGGTGLPADSQRLRLVKGSGDAQYAVLNGVRYHIADLDTLAVLNLGSYEQVSDGELAALRVGPVLRFFPGALIRDDTGRVWQIGHEWQRHWIPDLATFNALGFTWDRVQQTPDWAVGRLPEGPPLSARS